MDESVKLELQTAGCVSDGESPTNTDTMGVPCQSLSLSSSNTQANVWKGARLGGESVTVVFGTAGV